MYEKDILEYEEQPNELVEFSAAAIADEPAIKQPTMERLNNIKQYPKKVIYIILMCM